MDKKELRKFHAVASYLAMYPYQVPEKLIEEYTKEGDLVLDPFSGRGTTIFESRILNRKSIGVDLNPLAYILSHAKSKNYKLDEIYKRLDFLEKKFKRDNWEINLKEKKFENMKVFFSKYNLEQLDWLREKYGKKYEKVTNIDKFILALVMGILHGAFRRNGETNYLSVNTINTISLSPNYAKGFIEKNKLVKPKNNMFDQIRKRVKHFFKEEAIELKYESDIHYGSAIELKELFDKKVDAIITSPPYLDVIRYARQNWMRMWVLGYDNAKMTDEIKLDDRHKYNDYVKFMKKYFNSASEVLKSGSTMILVVGDVKQKGKDFTFKTVWNEIKQTNEDFRLVTGKKFQDFEDNKKQTMMLNSRVGKATNRDRIYIFKKR